MSTIIKFDLKELRKLVKDKDSCVIEKKVTQNIALQPWCLGNLKESIKNLLDYKIGKYDKEFNGILLSYKNLRILQNVGTIRNDNSDIHFQIQADYFIFRPHIGATIRGIVNKKSVTHLGLLVHRVFNVVIPRPTEEPGNKWIGTRIQEGQEVMFRIVVLDLFGALPYIRGELDESSIQTNTEGDIETLKTESLNVSYVNFDKTKPNLQHKQNGDELSPTSPQGSRKAKSPDSIKQRHSVNETTPKFKAKIAQSEDSISEKKKAKRQSRPSDTDGTRHPKKNKRES